MRETTLKISEVACLAGTRVMLGAGIAPLVAGRLSPEGRRRGGWALFAAGAASTFPLAMKVCRNSREVGVKRLPSAFRRLRRWRG